MCPGYIMGVQGVRRTRKWCRVQQRPITRARMPCCQRRSRSLTMRQCLTWLLTCAIRSRRWLSAWFASYCSHVGSAIHGGAVKTVWGETPDLATRPALGWP